MKTVKEVIKVLFSVLFMAAFTVGIIWLLLLLRRYSRILSKTTTVSLVEYPATVSSAATTAWSMSVKGNRSLNNEKK